MPQYTFVPSLNKFGSVVLEEKMKVYGKNVKMAIFNYLKGNNSYKGSSDSFDQIEKVVALLILYNRYAIRFPVSLLLFEIFDI